MTGKGHRGGQQCGEPRDGRPATEEPLPGVGVEAWAPREETYTTGPAFGKIKVHETFKENQLNKMVIINSRRENVVQRRKNNCGLAPVSAAESVYITVID